MDTSSPAHPFSPTTPGPVAPGPGTPSSSATTTTAPAVCARGLTRAYGRGDAQVHALRGVDVDFASGAFTAIMGPSGSGKSTLLHCLAGLDARTSGSVRIGGTEITRALGLTDRLGHRPHELSGGQQQRVAVARALLTRPDVVFGDEPTGNLDTATSTEVLGLLRRSAREMGQTVIMVTHDPVAASAADRVVLLADGRLAGELVDPTVESVTAALTALSAPAEGGVR